MSDSIVSFVAASGERRHPRYHYLATDGRITIWKQTRKRLHSAVIREGICQWRVARPSGPACFPVIRISHTQYMQLVMLWLRTPSGGDGVRLENAALPETVKALLATPKPGVVTGWDRIEAGKELV